MLAPRPPQIDIVLGLDNPMVERALCHETSEGNQLE